MKQGRAWNIGMTPAQQCAGFDPAGFALKIVEDRKRFTRNSVRRGEKRNLQLEAERARKAKFFERELAIAEEIEAEKMRKARALEHAMIILTGKRSS